MGKHVARPEDVISIINWYEEIIKNLKKKIIDMLYRKAIYLKKLKEEEKILKQIIQVILALEKHCTVC